MDLVGKRFWFFLISGLVILPGLISLMIPPSLKPGIEFTGGSTLTVTFVEPASETAVSAQFAARGHTDAVVQRLGDRSFFIRTATLKEAQLDATGQVVTPSERELIRRALAENVGAIDSLEFASVSPVVAQETVRNSAIVVVIASLGILLYITWAFRKVPKPFRWGVCAVIALLHDVVVVLGTFSILGKVMNIEVNAMFITALLTVMGYSVHDTIVVFDRIREHVVLGTEKTFEATVNASLNETLGRSLNTSLTSLFTLLALLLIGGPTIRSFLLVLLIGIVSGTYSSICNASQLLVVWEKGEFGKLMRRLPLFRPRQAAAKSG